MEELINFVNENIPEVYRNLKVYKIPVVVKGKLVWYKYNNGEVTLENAPVGMKPMLIYDPNKANVKQESNTAKVEESTAEEELDPRAKRLAERKKKEEEKKAAREKRKKDLKKNKEEESQDDVVAEIPDDPRARRLAERKKKEEERKAARENRKQKVEEPVEEEYSGEPLPNKFTGEGVDEYLENTPEENLPPSKRRGKERPARNTEVVDGEPPKFSKKTWRIVRAVLFILNGLGLIGIGALTIVGTSMISGLFGGAINIPPAGGAVFIVGGILEVVLSIVLIGSRSKMIRAYEGGDYEGYKAKKSTGLIISLLLYIVMIGFFVVATKVLASTTTVNEDAATDYINNITYDEDSGAITLPEGIVIESTDESVTQSGDF